MSTHALSRTSPKGQPFVGTCFKGGMKNLTLRAATQQCQNPANLTQDEALMVAIKGKPA